MPVYPSLRNRPTTSVQSLHSPGGTPTPLPRSQTCWAWAPDCVMNRSRAATHPSNCCSMPSAPSNPTTRTSRFSPVPSPYTHASRPRNEASPSTIGARNPIRRSTSCSAGNLQSPPHSSLDTDSRGPSRSFHSTRTPFAPTESARSQITRRYWVGSCHASRRRQQRTRMRGFPRCDPPTSTPP